MLVIFATFEIRQFQVLQLTGLPLGPSNTQSTPNSFFSFEVDDDATHKQFRQIYRRSDFNNLLAWGIDKNHSQHNTLRQFSPYDKTLSLFSLTPYCNACTYFCCTSNLFST